MYRMETSSQGRLGLQQVFPKNFEWKGKTFSEVTSLIKKNSNKDRKDYDSSIFFKPQPLKIYRREIASVSNTTDSRKSSTIQSFEIPGGSIMLDPTNNTFDCKGVNNTKAFHYNDIRDSYNPCSSCDVPLEGATDSTFVRSLSAQDNARRRVRSSGMNRTKFIANKNNTKNYFSSSSQYLHGRNKTFKQNQFNSLRMEGNHTEENVYASNTVQSCGTDASGNTSYVPVYYKPNNSKFAQQGGVSSSNRLVRLKYDTITDVGGSMTKVYGNHTANALAYGVSSNGYTIKDKIGYPNTCSLRFSQANPDGIKQNC